VLEQAASQRREMDWQGYSSRRSRVRCGTRDGTQRDRVEMAMTQEHQQNVTGLKSKEELELKKKMKGAATVDEKKESWCMQPRQNT